MGEMYLASAMKAMMPIIARRPLLTWVRGRVKVRVRGRVRIRG